MYIKYYISEKSHKNVFNIIYKKIKIPGSHERLPKRNMHTEKTKKISYKNKSERPINNERILFTNQGNTG